MLTIRKEQMAVFEAHLERRFRASLHQHVRKDLEAEAKPLSDVELDRLVTLAIERGRTYGVTSERDVGLFLDLMLLKGRDFDRDPKLLWARKILNDKSQDGPTKMKAIYGRLATLDNLQATPEPSP